MEKLTGVPLTDLDAIRSMTRADPTQVLVNALNTWFGTVMGASSFHADVHAGEGGVPTWTLQSTPNRQPASTLTPSHTQCWSRAEPGQLHSMCRISD